jgi:hypothetical protein
MAADGKGILKIARELNEAGVVNPTGQFRTFVDEAGNPITLKNGKAMKGTWAQTGIRGILANTVYIGQQIYGRTAWCWGDSECSKLGATLKSGTAPVCKRKKHKYHLPESRWLRADRPELRIVSAELWEAAQERLARSRELFLTRTKDSGRLHGRPKCEGGIESKYLLSGFLVCAACGGRMMITKRTSRRGRPITYYVCSTHRTRAGACSVRGSLRVTEAHERVTKLFLEKVLTPEALKDAVDGLVKRGSEAEVLAARRAPLAADLARLDRELNNLTAAIATTGQRPDVVLAAIAEREASRKKIAAELASLERQEQVARDFDAGAEERRLREELKTWRDLLEREPEHGRAALRQMRRGAIRARWEGADQWTLFGVASFGGVIRRLYDVLVPAEESEWLDRYADHLNAELEAGREPFEALAIAGGPAEGPASHDGSLAFAGTSAVQRPTCPRGEAMRGHDP